MSRRDLRTMSKLELVHELEKLEAIAGRFLMDDEQGERERLVHDLEVHQVELEMQNGELRDAQALLEESRARYADLYDFAPVGYCTLDAEGRLREINLTGAALLGAPREELLGKSFAAAGRIKDRRVFEAHMRRCLGTEARATSELTLEGGKRRTRIVQLISDPMRDPISGTLAWRTALVDISELKQLEAKLRLLSDAGRTLAASLDPAATLEAIARMVVPTLADGCMIDLQGADGRLDRPVVRFADPERRDALAESLKRLVSRPGFPTPQAAVIASGEPVMLSEMWARLPPQDADHDQRGADPWRALGVRSMMVVPLLVQGRSLGALTLMNRESGRSFSSSDLSLAQDLAHRAAMALDNARLHADAHRAVAARDATLALVSHDLRNPLSVILMRATSMQQQPGTERRTRSRKALDSIRRSAERMGRLIKDLLDVSSIEAQRFAIVRSRQPVAPLVAEALGALESQARFGSLTLARDFPGGDGFDVDCDRDRVQQVLANLVGNAIKFTPAGGTITVRVELRGDQAHFAVSDTGSGIAADDLPHVFDRFWQAQKTARMGTGLGLSISRGIVEAHGGRIWVESEVGVGTTFFFVLPLAERRASASPSRGLILIADDDDDHRESMGEVLMHAGFEVAYTANGAEALEYLRRGGPVPTSIVLDLEMPVMDGWAFLDERSLNPALRAIPVVVVSGQRNVGDQVTRRNARYARKPVAADRLIEMVGRK